MIINYMDKATEIYKDINTYGNNDKRRNKMFKKLEEWIMNGMCNKFEGLEIQEIDD